MNTNPSFSFDLHPELDAELNAAYERHAIVDADLGDLANNGLAEVIAQAAPDNDPLWNPNLSKQFAERLTHAHAETMELFNLLKMNEYTRLPELTDSEFADVAWEKLAKSYETMEQLGLEPEIIFSPLAANTKLWDELYASIPNSQTGLIINRDLAVLLDMTVAKTDGSWEVSVIAGSDELAIKDVPAHMSAMDDENLKKVIDLFTTELGIANPSNKDYPSIPEYLTLQAVRLNRGTRPVDYHESTWLRPVSDKSISTPTGEGSQNNGVVCLDWRDPYDSDHLGLRPVIRGAKP